MILHVRQLAWLNSKSKDAKESRLRQFKAQDENHQSLELPPVERGYYLVEYLTEAGVCMSSGMGLQPLSWQEIEAWQRATALSLTPWEVITLREMSEAYSTEYSASDNELRSPPYTPKVEEEDIARKEVSDKLKSIFRGLKEESPVQK